MIRIQHQKRMVVHGTIKKKEPFVPNRWYKLIFLIRSILLVTHLEFPDKTKTTAWDTKVMLALCSGPKTRHTNFLYCKCGLRSGWSMEESGHWSTLRGECICNGSLAEQLGSWKTRGCRGFCIYSCFPAVSRTLVGFLFETETLLLLSLKQIDGLLHLFPTWH